MCKRQQSWKWRWRSRDRSCPFVQLSRTTLCTRLAGKRILLYGDSLTQQFFVSLATLAGRVEASWRPVGCERMRHLECVRVCGSHDDLDSAEVCQRTKFGLALDELPRRWPFNCSLQPSVVAPLHEKFLPSCLRRFDFVILSEVAHWVGVDGALGLQACLERKGHDAIDAARLSQAFVTRLYERQMRRNADYLRTMVTADASDDDRQTRILFRTSPPGYPTADLLSPDTQDGAPPIFTAPSQSVNWVHALVAKGTSRYNHHLIPALNEIARRAFTGSISDAAVVGARVGVMDVEVPMMPRVDGHLDPLHYCLPGPADFYSEVLHNYVLSP